MRKKPNTRKLGVRSLEITQTFEITFKKFARSYYKDVSFE